jgi:hypothetical protein
MFWVVDLKLEIGVWGRNTYTFISDVY